jgi:CBS domain containing-hemolysin-like protein
MQHYGRSRSSLGHESIPLLPAQARDFHAHRTETGATQAAEVIESPLTVHANVRASSAIAMMRGAACNAALVTQPLRDGRYERVVGLVTSLKLEQELLAQWEPEIVVGDEMSPWDQVSIVNAASVRALTLGQLHDMFRGTGLSHVVVVDDAEDCYTYVIGLLSRATLAQRLGRLPQRSPVWTELAPSDTWEAARYAQH